MPKGLFILLILFLTNCQTTKVTTLDHTVIREETVCYVFSKPDTLKLMTLWSGEIITVKEFNRRWDESINKTTKKLKKQK